MAAASNVSGWGNIEGQGGLFKTLPGSINPYVEYRANKDAASPAVSNSIERYVPTWWGPNGDEDRDGLQNGTPARQMDDECWDGSEWRWVAWIDLTPPDVCQ
jgi:hypothetical protein